MAPSLTDGGAADEPGYKVLGQAQQFSKRKHPYHSLFPVLGAIVCHKS